MSADDRAPAIARNFEKSSRTLKSRSNSEYCDSSQTESTIKFKARTRERGRSVSQHEFNVEAKSEAGLLDKMPRLSTLTEVSTIEISTLSESFAANMLLTKGEIHLKRSGCSEQVVINEEAHSGESGKLASVG
jgi:hypothetical protein